MVGATLACGWHNVGLWLAQCWCIVDTTLANYSWQNVGLYLVLRWLMVGTTLGDGWHTVGFWLAHCWFMVGRMLLYGWRFMLGQRVSNEQSNVGPTKYVAVGPTTNGWVLVGEWLSC